MVDIIISEFMYEPAVDALSKEFDVLYDPDLVNRPEDLGRLLADGGRGLIVRNRTRVSAAIIENAKELVAVGRLGVGLDNIDLAACHQQGIRVFPATGANALAVAEYTIAAIMMLLRGAYHSNDDMIAGAWPREQLSGKEISGKTLGIVGLGSIGSEVAKRALSLGMRVGAFDPYLDPAHPSWRGVLRYPSLEKLAEGTDILTLHLPLSPATRGLVGDVVLDKLPNDAFVINTARGGILDETALVERMQQGKISGAALDVFENEPLSEDDAVKFRGLTNLILTPHIAGLTDEANKRVSLMTAQNIREALVLEKS